jgi:hypothetical protein
MNDGRLVPRESETYREFARLYHLARRLRPTDTDRWNGDLYATGTENWGEFSPKSGDMGLSGPLVLQRLTASPHEISTNQRAEALATVLHEATHASMATDAPDEPNAVRSPHSLGLMEGFAEIRTVQDFPAFARLAGYPGLDLPTPAYPGAHAATQNLLQQVSGPAKDRLTFIDEAAHGPAVMHFDQLADGVVRNRLAEVVPYKAEDRLAVRAALIATMLHRGWPTLKDMSASTGEAVAEDIRRSLNAKVDEIRQHYQAKPHQTFPADVPNQYAARVAAESRAPAPAQAQQATAPAGPEGQLDSTMRFLSGQAPAAQATRAGSALGDGARGVGTSSGPARPVRQAGSTRPGGADRAPH